MNGADTSWMLMSTALVLLMTPGLALFLGPGCGADDGIGKRYPVSGKVTSIEHLSPDDGNTYILPAVSPDGMRIAMVRVPANISPSASADAIVTMDNAHRGRPCESPTPRRSSAHLHHSRA